MHEELHTRRGERSRMGGCNPRPPNITTTRHGYWRTGVLQPLLATKAKRKYRSRGAVMFSTGEGRRRRREAAHQTLTAFPPSDGGFQRRPFVIETFRQYQKSPSRTKPVIATSSSLLARCVGVASSMMMASSLARFVVSRQVRPWCAKSSA
jgi:hypothetical protein